MNAPNPIVEIVDGVVTLAKELQPQNAHAPMDVTPSAIFTAVIDDLQAYHGMHYEDPGVSYTG